MTSTGSNQHSFYVMRMGTEQGPLSHAQIQHLAASKSIQRNTQVRLAEGGNWFPAQEVPGVFSSRSWVVALVLSVIVGSIGVDRFYVGHIGLGILKLITLGGFGVWWLIDLILFAVGQIKDSDGLPVVP